MVDAMRKTVLMSVTAGILVMGLLGIIAVPVHAVPIDPTYFLDCSAAASAGPGAHNLQEGITPLAATCPAGGLTASGTAVTPYTVGAGSDGAIYVNMPASVSGTYSLVDCGSSATCATFVGVASGSFSGTGTSIGCAGANTILFAGSANVGAIVKSGDIMMLTLTLSPGTVSFCSGGTAGGALTPTAVNTTSHVPLFGMGVGLALAIGFAGVLVLKRKATLPAPL